MFLRKQPREPSRLETHEESLILSQWSLPVPDTAVGKNGRERRQCVRSLFLSASKQMWDEA